MMPATKPPNPFTTLKFKDGLFRIWLDKEQHPYKLEVRSKEYMGYFNPDEFPKIVKTLARFIK